MHTNALVIENDPVPSRQQYHKYQLEWERGAGTGNKVNFQKWLINL